MVKVLAEVTGSISFSQRGENGEKGDNGVGVKGFNTYYGLSSSKSSPPTTYNYDTLSETIISQNSEKYVWSADKVLYTDGTGDDFINAYCIGKCSDLTSVKEQYGTSTSAGTKPSSWGYSYPSNPANGTYVWSRDEIVWTGNNSTTHSDAQLIGYIAVNGATGNGIKSTEVTYKIGSSGTTPPEGTWDTNVPNITDEKPYLWTRTIFKYTNGRSVASFSVATRGTKGALMREHDGFESGKYKYLSGSGAEEYIDVVCVSGSWYQCIQTYETDSPSLDKHWLLMSNYKSIATHLLLAENATINMLGTNQINLFNPTDTTDSKMYGSFRVVKDVNDWSLWLGGETGDSASFAVTRGGVIKAMAGRIGSFVITERKDPTGFVFYSLHATHNSFGIIPACDVELDHRGIHVWSGNNTVTNYTKVDVGYNGGLDANNNPTWFNGVVNITGNTSSGGDDDVIAIYTNIYPKAGRRSYVLWSQQGDVFLNSGAFIGALRPNTTTDSYSRTLSESECYIICKNTSAITLTLPTNPREGQLYLVYQAGARVNFSTSSSHPIIAKGYGSAGQTTWYSDTQNQLSFITYGNDGRWYIAYTNG
jgi:hypothetical protein